MPQVTANAMSLKPLQDGTTGSLTFENNFSTVNERMAWSLQPRAINDAGAESNGYSHLVFKADSQSGADNTLTQMVLKAATTASTTGLGSGEVNVNAVSGGCLLVGSKSMGGGTS